MTLAAGARLGSYEIVTPLGVGGMGEVYRAKDTKLGRDVAIKILPASFTSDPERVARFRREAQVLASLNHAHIAQIHGLEEAGGTPFLVLELVDGESLDKRIARGRIPVEEALGITRQVAEALETAHEKGIVHRDLKPANIALTQEGQVKVLDFGLAKAVETTSGSSDLLSSPTITSPVMMTGVGVILGTAAYMAPEQAKGRLADKRSDLWALGCVLYELLTGTRAFGGDDVSDTLANVLKSEPNWNALRADVGERVRTLLRRCLDKDRNRRVADASVVRFVLTEQEPPASAIANSDSRTVWWKRLAVPAALVLIAAGVVAGVIVNSKRSPELPVARFRIDLPDGQQFAARTSVMAVSPDGQQIAYAAVSSASPFAPRQIAQLYLRPLAEADAHPIPGTSLDVMSPFFSPDGQEIGFYSFQDSTLKAVPLSGGTPRTICKADPPYGVTWDGKWIVFADQGLKGILRVSQEGGEAQVLVPVGPGEVFGGPQMLDDGRTILYTVASKQLGLDDRWKQGEVVMQTVGSTERNVVLRGGSEARFLSTGHLVYETGGTLMARLLDRTRHPRGGPVPLIEGVRRFRVQVGAPAASYGVSANGSLVYIPAATEDSEYPPRSLSLLTRDGKLEQLPLPAKPYKHPRISPDGTKLAVETEDAKEAIIWTYDLKQGGQAQRLTFGGRNRYPIWTPDGRRITFQSDRDGEYSMYVQPADGTGTAEQLAKPVPGGRYFPEAWSPDRSTLIFVEIPPYDARISALSTDKSPTRRPLGQDLPGRHVSFSPDGKWLAYSSPEIGSRLEVFVQPFPATGEKHQISTEGGTTPVWGRDQRRLYYWASSTRQFVEVDVSTGSTFTVGTRVALPVSGVFFDSGLWPQANYDVMPDGRFIVVTAADREPQGPKVTEVGQTSRGAGRQAINVVLNWIEELKQRVPTR